jgi:hypothetical protein
MPLFMSSAGTLEFPPRAREQVDISHFVEHSLIPNRVLESKRVRDVAESSAAVG